MTLPNFSHLGLVTQGTEDAWAVTTPDDRYRYMLGRAWDDRIAPMVFGMMNPSTARHDKTDPTMRKCVGFATRGHAGGIVIVNMLAFSATDPRDMVRSHAAGVDVVGEHNVTVISRTLDTFYIRVAAWGKIPPRLRGVAQRSILAFRSAMLTPHCLGLNDDGSPRHPLMLSYETPLVLLSEAERNLAAGLPHGLPPIGASVEVNHARAPAKAGAARSTGGSGTSPTVDTEPNGEARQRTKATVAE